MNKILPLALVLMAAISPKLNAQIAGTPVVCVGASTTLSDALPGGSWSSGTPSVAVVSIVSGAVYGVSAGTATISYVAGATTHTRVVTVNSLPVAGTLSGSSSVCTGASIALATTVAGGSWGTATGNTAVAGGTVTGISAGPDTIIYTVTNSCGSAFTRKAVTVNTLPSVSAISGAASVCVSASVTLTDATPAGVWGVSNSHASVSSSGVVTGVSAGIDTVLYSLTNTCGTTTVIHAVTIVPLPFPGLLSGPSAVCIGSSITLSSTVSGGAWSASNASATVAAGTVSGVAAGADTISYSVTNICGTDVAVAVVTVSAVPVAGSISGPGIICEGAAVSLTASVPGGTWGMATGAASVSGGVVTGMLAGADTILYTVSTACGSDVAAHPVTVDPLPDAGIISGASGVCNGSAISLSSSGTGGTWFSDDATIADIDVMGNVDGLRPGLTTIRYAVANTCGADTSWFAVSVDMPAAPFACPMVLCSLDSVVLSDATPGGTWSSDNALTASIIFGNVLLPLLPGTATISYTVTNACGTTTETKDILVIVCLPLEQKLTTATTGKLEIYPNPGNGNFTVTCNSPVNDEINISIIDATGRRISQFTIQTNKTENVHLSVPSGVYTIIAVSAGERRVEKLMINK